MANSISLVGRSTKSTVTFKYCVAVIISYKWRLSPAVTSLVASTKLLDVEPGYRLRVYHLCI